MIKEGVPTPEEIDTIPIEMILKAKRFMDTMAMRESEISMIEWTDERNNNKVIKELFSNALRRAGL